MQPNLIRESPTMSKSDDIPDLEDAIEQLAEFFGFNAHYDFKVDGERYRITYRQFLPPDVERAIQAADKSLEDCDRTEIILPNGRKAKGPGYAIPYQRNGEILPDQRDALRLIAMWGEEKYRKFEAYCNRIGSGSSELLTAVWAKMDAEYEKWRSTGSKSSDRD